MNEGFSRRALLRGAGTAFVAGSLAACGSREPQAAPPLGSQDLVPAGPRRQVTAEEAFSDPAGAAAGADRAAFIPKGSRNSNKVAIMFHGDGDRATTESALRVLKREKVTVSVFAIGTWLIDQPTVATLITASGHELGNHSYSHPDFSKITPAVMKTEIERCRDVLVKQTGAPGMGLLAPEVDLPVPVLLQLARQAGYDKVIGWDVDPRDWADPGPEAILRIVGGGSRPGSIVQMHLGHPETVKALPRVIAKLRSRGLEPTSVSNLLAG
ncbi:MAG: polysaccharide deacetylase family protein [Mycobacteriales bacterium]